MNEMKRSVLVVLLGLAALWVIVPHVAHDGEPTGAGTAVEIPESPKPAQALKFATPLDAARSVYAGFDQIDNPLYNNFTLHCERPRPAECEHGKLIVLKYQDKSVSVRSARQTFLERTRDVVPLILKSFSDVDSVAIRAYSDFVDIRGNESNDILISIRIDRKNSDATNWAKVSLDNIPRFADTYWQHQSVTKELGDPSEERRRLELEKNWDCSSGLCYPRH
jgi:hypothetical protein